MEEEHGHIPAGGSQTPDHEALVGRVRQALRQVRGTGPLANEERERLMSELVALQVEVELQREDLAETQARLSTARARYLQLFEHAPVPYLLFNTRHEVLDLNTAAQKLFQRDRLLLLGRQYLTALERHSRDRLHATLNATFEQGTRDPIVLGLLGAGGALRQIEAHGQLFESAELERLCLLTLVDVTEKQEAERRADLLSRAADVLGEHLIVLEPAPNIADAPRLVSFNRSARRFFGWPAGRRPAALSTLGEAMGLTVPAPLAFAIRDALEGKASDHLQYELRAKAPTWFEASVVPVTSPRGLVTHVVITQQDITARRHEEMLLRESHEVFRLACESTSDVIFDHDVRAARVHWFDFVAGDRHPHAPHFGSAPGHWATLLHPDDRDRVLAAYSAHLRAGDRFEMQYRLLSPDGEYRHWAVRARSLRDDSGQVVRTVGALIDIHDRVVAEEARQRSTEEYLRLHETNVVPLVYTQADGRIYRANQMFCDLIGYTPEEVESGAIDCRRITPPEQQARDEEAKRNLVRIGSVPPYEKEFLRHDGTRIQVLVGPSLLTTDPEPRIVSYVLDVSRQREAARQLAEANAALESRVRERTAALLAAKEATEKALTEADAANRAKSEFLSRMSHELRTPLNAVLGFAQLMYMRATRDDDRDQLQKIVTAGSYLLSLINDVLDIARIESGGAPLQLAPTPIGPVIRQSIDLLRARAEARGIRLAEPEGDATVLADANVLRQIVTNILSNAVKYNRDGGAVTSTVVALSGRVALRIADEGPGIPPQLRPRLFRPFDRLGLESSGIEGSGLGLLLTRRLVEAQGGTIAIDCPDSGGTVVTISLPEAAAPAEGAAETAPPPRSGAPVPMIEPLHPGRALYIEDNPANMQLVRDILEMAGVSELLTAPNGTTGIQLARRELPAIVLLDNNLPDMPGSAVLHALRADPVTRPIPVVIVSADAIPEQIEEMMRRGADDYITKPINIGAFLRVINKHLARLAGV